MPQVKSGRGALLVAGLAALLASACCLGPLILVSVGLGGAWIGNLTVLEPYRPFFIATAVAALLLAWRRIDRPAQDCSPGDVCALPQVRSTYRTVFRVVAALTLVAFAFPYALPLFY